MAQIAKVTVHGIELAVDVEKLTPESLVNMATTALTRRLSLGAKTKTTEELTALAVELANDPNKFFASTRGIGVSRPKLDIYERKAKSWFSDFLAALKIGTYEDINALWKRAGGSGVLLTAKEDATPDQKAAVDRNKDARDKLIAAKIKKLKDSGWAPETI